MKNIEEDKKSQKENAKRVTYSAVVFCIEQHNRAIEFVYSSKNVIRYRDI